MFTIEYKTTLNTEITYKQDFKDAKSLVSAIEQLSASNDVDSFIVLNKDKIKIAELNKQAIF